MKKCLTILSVFCALGAQAVTNIVLEAENELVGQTLRIGAVELELCDAHGGTAKLLLDAAGNPIADPRHCPDCLAATLAPDGTPADLPARPKGGVGQGARAVLQALPAILGL